jgi:hypothetical protein
MSISFQRLEAGITRCATTALEHRTKRQIRDVLPLSPGQRWDPSGSNKPFDALARLMGEYRGHQWLSSTLTSIEVGVKALRSVRQGPLAAHKWNIIRLMSKLLGLAA